MTTEPNCPLSRTEPTPVQITRQVRVLDLLADCECADQEWHIQGCMMSGLMNHPWTKAA